MSMSATAFQTRHSRNALGLCDRCAECETLDMTGQRLCVGATMLASAEATPRVNHAISMLLECSL